MHINILNRSLLDIGVSELDVVKKIYRRLRYRNPVTRVSGCQTVIIQLFIGLHELDKGID